MRTSAVTTELASAHARGLPPVVSSCVKVGTNAALMAPSANRSRDEVGHAERDAKRIHRVAGAEVKGQDLVADQPQDAAGHGRQTEQSGRTGQARSGVQDARGASA